LRGNLVDTVWNQAMGILAKRKRLLVDPSFQLRLVLLLGWQLLVCTVIVFHIYFLYFAVWSLLDTSIRKDIVALYKEFISQEKLILITLLVVSPIVAYQIFKFSHRIAGPLFRSRQLLRDMAAGKIVPEFKPRKYDLLGDFFTDFNALIRESNARNSKGQNAENGRPDTQDHPPSSSNGCPEPLSLVAQ
jgi:hypothetical protein